MLQAVKAAARLHGGVQVGRREGQSGSLAGTVAGSQAIQTESIGGVRFLGCDDAASGPLGATVVARKRHRADYAVAVHDGAPHLIVQAAGLRSCSLGQGALQRRVAGETVARIRVATSVIRPARGLACRLPRESCQNKNDLRQHLPLCHCVLLLLKIQGDLRHPSILPALNFRTAYQYSYDWQIWTNRASTQG